MDDFTPATLELALAKAKDDEKKLPKQQGEATKRSRFNFDVEDEGAQEDTDAARRSHVCCVADARMLLVVVSRCWVCKIDLRPPRHEKQQQKMMAPAKKRSQQLNVK